VSNKKVKVALQEIFEFTVDGESLPGFVIEESWEGLHKLRNEEGQTVIVNGNPSNEEFVEVLRMSSGLCSEGAGCVDRSKYYGEFKPTHTHTENGCDYQLLYVGNTKATKKSWNQQAVYTDGATIWVRPADVFAERYKPKVM